MGKRKETAIVQSQREIVPGVFDLRLRTEHIAAEAVPGQFVSVYTGDKSRLLPRPISICEADSAKGLLRLVYRVAGGGTAEFSGLEEGDTVDLLGPLGNGYQLGTKKALLIGGGIGIPPMLELAKRLDCEKQIVLGYANADLFLKEDLEQYGPVAVATDDGSAGTHGTVLDAIRENGLEADVIYACGPKPMLRALKAYAAEKGIECWLSLEERMACGIGACLGCVCETVDIDDHSKVRNARICKDGPVFAAEEVVL